MATKENLHYYSHRKSDQINKGACIQALYIKMFLFEFPIYWFNSYSNYQGLTQVKHGLITWPLKKIYNIIHIKNQIKIHKGACIQALHIKMFLFTFPINWCNFYSNYQGLTYFKHGLITWSLKKINNIFHIKNQIKINKGACIQAPFISK